MTTLLPHKMPAESYPPLQFHCMQYPCIASTNWMVVLLLREHSGADVAAVGLLSRVHAQVRGEAAIMRERLGADVAAVGLLPRMRAQVLGEVALHTERLGADVAAVGLLPRVRAQVLGEAALHWECHGADAQAVRRCFVTSARMPWLQIWWKQNLN